MQFGNNPLKRFVLIMLHAVFAFEAEAQAQVFELQDIALFGAVHHHARQNREELFTAPGFVVIHAEQ